MEAVNHQTAGKSAKAICSLPGKLMSLPLISLALARISFPPIRNSLVARIASPSPRRSHSISRARNPAGDRRATGDFGLRAACERGATWIFGTAVRPLAKGAVSQSWLRVISSFDLYHQSERPGEQARRQQGSRHGDEPRLEGAGCVAQPSHQIGSGKTPGRAD